MMSGRWDAADWVMLLGILWVGGLQAGEPVSPEACRRPAL